MFPVRRIAPLALTAALAVTGFAPATGTAAPAAAACQPGAISSTTSEDGTVRTTVCDRDGEQLETSATPASIEQTRATNSKPTGGISLSAAAAGPQVRCAIAGSKQKGRAGSTLVVIVRTTKAKKTVQRQSTPFICGADSEWRQVSSPFAGVTLIPTSTVITRTQRA